MVKSFFQRQKAQAENLNALQSEIARQLRGRLDLMWPLPPHLDALLHEFELLDTPRSPEGENRGT